MSGFLSIFRKGADMAISPPRTAPATPEPAGARPHEPGASAIPAPITAAALAAKKQSRVVFAFDATASRQSTWHKARLLTDTLLGALPGKLEVALAVHSGERVWFSGFTSNAAKLRDLAAGVTCKAGATRLLPILKRVARMGDVPIVIYVGDAYEEGSPRRVADALKDCGSRVIILHDGPPPAAFGEIVERTGGALLPFDISALGDLLAAIAVLAVGNVELLEAKRETMPAATLLLEHLGGGKQIGRG